MLHSFILACRNYRRECCPTTPNPAARFQAVLLLFTPPPSCHGAPLGSEGLTQTFSAMAAGRFISKVSQSFQHQQVKYNTFQKFWEERVIFICRLIKIQFSKSTLLGSIAVPTPEFGFSVASTKWFPFS